MSEQTELFRLVPHVKTRDGQSFESIQEARQHELEGIKGEEPTDSFSAIVVANWPRILEIMTSEPGAEKPKVRKRRKDFGTKRPPKPDALSADK